MLCRMADQGIDFVCITSHYYKVDAETPGASLNQKFGMMTEIGLNHRENDVINQVVDCYDGSDKTSDFVDNCQLSFFGKMAGLSFSAPGVKADGRVWFPVLRTILWNWFRRPLRMVRSSLMLL